MDLNKEEIIKEIRKGSEIGKQIFEIELDYYKSLVKDRSSPKEVQEMENMNIHKAYLFGKEKHKGQKDDEDNDYFETHCMGVLKIVEQVTRNPIILIASMLHDTLEDTKTTYVELVNEFGKDIAFLVAEVTHEGKADESGFYFPRLESKEAIMIKFADRLSNLSRMNSWDEKRQKHYLNQSKFWRTKSKSESS